ncbi:MAG: MoaD/ThiS family protein [Chloroflexi bacterium]|nr:MoaD/ThiS family protein [Chloroflexota bacterium]MBL7061136.1 MoaD/ThiS family protein [Dehalococcoidia bacterium]
MNVEVLFFGQLRELTAVRQTTVGMNDGTRLVDLIEHLGEEYGDAFRHEVNTIRRLQILINGQQHTFLGGIEASLKDGDTVVFLPPIFGG